MLTQQNMTFDVKVILVCPQPLSAAFIAMNIVLNIMPPMTILK